VRDAQVGGWPAGASVDLGEFLLGAGEADLESFDLAGPALAAGVGNTSPKQVLLSPRWKPRAGTEASPPEAGIPA
jgi:hypothetical protein